MEAINWEIESYKCQCHTSRTVYDNTEKVELHQKNKDLPSPFIRAAQVVFVVRGRNRQLQLEQQDVVVPPFQVTIQFTIDVFIQLICIHAAIASFLQNNGVAYT